MVVGITRVVAATVLMTAPALATGEESHESFEGVNLMSADLEELLATPVVEWASKRRQSLHDAPMAVEVITADEIAAMEATNIADVLRRAVGVHVVQYDAASFDIGMRGINVPINDRVLVLVDGRKVDEQEIRNTMWLAMPIQPGDIERIEVIRGPGSTLYGANAYSGVVSIITKRALDHRGLEASAKVGLNYLPDVKRDDPTGAGLDNWGAGRMAYNWTNEASTLGLRLGLGFNNSAEWVNPDANAVKNHGFFNYNAYLTGDYRPTARLETFVSVSHVMAEGIYFRGATSGIQRSTISEQDLVARFKLREMAGLPLDLSVHVDGRQQNIFSGTLNVDGEPGIQDVTNRTGHAVAQLDLALFGGANILTLGGEASVQDFANIFDSTISSSYLAVLGQNETRLLDEKLVINLGARLEQISTRDQGDTEIVYRSLSPRGAILYKLSSEHSVRIGGATAYRTPNAFESIVSVHIDSWQDPAIPDTVFVVANPRLDPERVLSAEVGYRGRLHEAVRADLTLFRQQSDGRVELDYAHDTLPTRYANRLDLIIQGVELGTRFVFGERTFGYLNYTFTHAGDLDTDETNHDFPQHLVGFGLETRLPHALRLNLDTTVFSATRPTFRATGTSGYELRTVEVPPQVIVNLRIGRFIFGDSGEVFVAANNIAGFFRHRKDLRQYPAAESAAPIGATILIGLTIHEPVASEVEGDVP